MMMKLSSILSPDALAVVVGAGTSGSAAARLLHALGTRVRILDHTAIPETLRDWAIQNGVETITAPHKPAHFVGAKLVVASPGIPPTMLQPLLEAAGNPPLVGEMELALQCTNTPILAVTGTSGKTTTASLAAAMLERAGRTVFLGGNIGTPLSEYVLAGRPVDVLVLELSSFQLQGCPGLKPKVGMILNLTANHLDHHKDMAEYTDAKFSLFTNMDPEDLAVLPPELEVEYRRRHLLPRLELIGAGTEFTGLRLAGKHNAANAEAAWLACRPFGVSLETAVEAARDFAPLPHRLEQVEDIDGTVFINDSKSTTVESLRVALESFDSPVYLLAGGKFKGGDLDSLRPLLEEKVTGVALYGGSGDTFSKAWEGAAPISRHKTLEEAVRHLFAEAHSAEGGTILLSPATSSYDQYPNYIARGEDFRRVANALREVTQ